jgi:hypothetical protein
MFRVFRDSSAATSRRPVERVLCVRGDREQLFRRGVGSWRRESRNMREVGEGDSTVEGGV